jgi:hypothetical protein
MLGYQGYVSAKELKKQDMESKMDNVLKSIKSYVREEGEEEAI